MLRAEAESQFRAKLADLDSSLSEIGKTHKELRADLEAVIANEVERRKSHKDVLSAIADLPQLFIAV